MSSGRRKIPAGQTERTRHKVSHPAVRGRHRATGWHVCTSAPRVPDRSMSSVLIVGSGFTGFECARNLVKRFRRHTAQVDVTIISPIDHALHPAAAGRGRRCGGCTVRDDPCWPERCAGCAPSAGGWIRPTWPATPDLHRPEDRTHRIIVGPAGADPARLPDSSTSRAWTPTPAAWKSTAEALYLRDHVLEQLELASIDDDPPSRSGGARSWWWAPPTGDRADRPAACPRPTPPRPR